MCHRGVYNSICIEVVHPKNLINGHTFRIVCVSVHPSCLIVHPSNKAHVCQIRHIRAYSSIFEYILENIQRICQPRPIANGHVHSSVHPSRLYTMSLPPCPSFMTTLHAFIETSCILKFQSNLERLQLILHGS
jgi:hypothetical protein